MNLVNTQAYHLTKDVSVALLWLSRRLVSSSEFELCQKCNPPFFSETEAGAAARADLSESLQDRRTEVIMNDYTSMRACFQFYPLKLWLAFEDYWLCKKNS